MKILKYFEQFLFEKNKNKDKNKDKVYSYGCLMLYYDFPEIKKLHNIIDKDDIHEIGLETEPHTTLLYGLHDNEINDDELFDHVLKKHIPNLILYNPSLFENAEFDVLKFDVKQQTPKNDDYKKKDDILFIINKELCDNFPYTSDYPNYSPHNTIAYLEKGKGKKYVNMLKNEEYVVTPKYFIYSKSDGNKIKEKIDQN